MSSSGRGSGRRVRGAALVGLAMTFANVCAYGFVVIAARLLPPGTYGEVGAIMGLLLVLGVFSLGLQTSAARSIATTARGITSAEQRTLRSGLRAAAILLAAGLLLSPLVAAVLGLSSIATAAFAAVAAAALALMGAAAGLLHGERDWHGFALVHLLNGVGRLGVAGGVVLLWRDATGAALGVALGSLLPMLAALLAVRHRRRREPPSEAPARPLPARNAPGIGLVAVLRDSHLLLALLVLSNLDVLLARVVLSEHDSGLYAAGLIITKAVLFLPQFAITVAFPDMVDAGARRALRITLITVCATGSVAVVGVSVLAPLALQFVGGPQYAEVQSHLWLFALLGTVLSLVNVFVYRFIATARARREWWIWAAVLLVLAASPLVDSVAQLALLMATVDTALLVLLAWLESRDRARHAAAGEPDVSAPPRATTPPDRR